ncbi:MAG: ABC transporter permease [Ruminococcaceae bacterium]|nr:ABC transporter permease [Oscillospiraceae bacterium]
MKIKGFLRGFGNFIQRFYIVFLLIILYLPTAVLVMMSFNENTSTFEWTGFSIEKYKMLFENEDILESVVTTVGIGLLSALISTVLGTLACIGIMAMSRKLQTVIKTTTNIPMLNADIVTAIAFMLFFVRFFGGLGTHTVLIAHITLTLPYVILNVLPKITQFDYKIYEAALDLGATNFQAFRKVMLPDIMPGVITGFIFAATLSFNDFTLTYFTKPAGFETISTKIYSAVRTKGIRPEHYALATILFVIVLLILFIVNYKGNKNEGKKDK